MGSLPEKAFYKLNEVCQYTDTQPYVLRFWESEFPQLAPRKNRAGQKVYTRQDVELILRIKQLLHDEEYTIAAARRHLEEDPEEPRRERPTSRGGKRAEKARAERKEPLEASVTPRPLPPRAARVETSPFEGRGAGESVADFLPDPAARSRALAQGEVVRAEDVARAEARRRERADRIAARLEEVLETLLRPVELARG